MIKFLLIFILIIYLIVILGRMLFSNFINRISNQNHSEFRQNQRKEGDVTVNMSEKAEKKFNNTDGEYVDYEEVN